MSICVQATAQRPLTHLKQASKRQSVAMVVKFDENRMDIASDFRFYATPGCLLKEVTRWYEEQHSSWSLCLGIALAFLPNCMRNPVFTNYSRDENSLTTKQKKPTQKQSNFFLWFTPDSFFQRDPLVPNGLPPIFSTLIPCQKTSSQCHHLQPSNNDDVPSSLLYFCKARSFTQENKYRWPIGRACFVSILKKRLKKMLFYLSQWPFEVFQDQHEKIWGFEWSG